MEEVLMHQDVLQRKGVVNTICSFVAKRSGVQQSDLEHELDLVDECGLDILDVAALIDHIENQHSIELPDAENWFNVGTIDELADTIVEVATQQTP